MAAFEVLGVASIMPFLSLLSNPDILEQNKKMLIILEFLGNFGLSNMSEFLIFLGFSSFAIVFSVSIYRAFAIYKINNFVEMNRHIISSELLNNIIQQHYEYFITKHSSEFQKSILSEVDQFISQILRPFVLMCSHLILIITIAIFLMIVDPYLTVSIFLFFGILYFLISFGAKPFLVKFGTERTSANALRFKTTSEIFATIKEIKHFNCEQTYLSTFEKSSHKFSNAQKKLLTISIIPYYFIEAFAFGGIITIATFLFYQNQYQNSNFLLPILGIYAFASYRIQPSLRAIYQGWASLKFGKTIVNNIYEFKFKSNKNENEKNEDKIPICLEDISLGLHKVFYKYPNAIKYSLQDITLYISTGSTVAIVGESGAGKSTLVDVILGLLSPQSGNVYYGEYQNRNNLSYSRKIGYVPQEVSLISDTIAANIAFGCDRSQIDLNKVKLAAKHAGIENFIEHDLSSAYETIIGENGITLSGGQRQRLGIARALFGNPDILVFDEATSALDTTTENTVMMAIEKIRGLKTIILIAHRIDTIANCDIIIELKKGEIAAMGSYKEYISSTGNFRK